MNTYDVLLTKIESARVRIEAENPQEAEDIAFDRLMHREISLADSEIPGKVSITVSEVGGRNHTVPGTITIHWADLTPAKQSELLSAFGDNCNYDVFPIAEIPTLEED